MTVLVKKFVELRSLPPRLVREQEMRPFALPPRAFPDQDQSSLLAGLGGASLGRLGHELVVPPVRLLHFTIENGLFFVGHRLDGTVLTGDGHPVAQTAAFRDRQEAGRHDETVVDAGPVQDLGEVFVGFDGAWRNYFHWLCFALVKSHIGARLFDPSVTIALPDYDLNTTERPASFSRIVFDQSLSCSGLADRVTLLAPGAYRASRIHLLWTSPGEPTDIMHLDEFREPFDAVASVLERGQAPPEPTSRRIYLARSRHVASRLDDAVADMIDEATARYGFEKISFEGLDLARQVSIVNQATHLISPHGAGLSNMLFNSAGTLNVLELNKPLDGGLNLRPWFLLAARARKLPYLYLDTAASDFSADRLDAALASFSGLR